MVVAKTEVATRINKMESHAHLTHCRGTLHVECKRSVVGNNLSDGKEQT